MQENEMTRKTRIIYMITKGIWGGAQEYVYTLATSMPQDNFDVLVACGEGNELPNKLRDRGVRVITFLNLQRDISVFKEIDTFFDIIKLLRDEQPDVLHLNSSKIGFLGALAGRIMGVPRIIFTAHGWAFNENRSALEKDFFLILHYLTVLLSHSTIVVSEKSKKNLANLPFISQKMTVIYNGISPITFKNRDESRTCLEEKTGSKIGEKIVLGTISELHKNKGVDCLIEALRQKQNHNLITYIIGNGEERERLHALVQDRNLESQIYFLGKIPNAKELLKGFDVFTLTSRTEALPYVLLEAGQAGLPIIASNVGGIPEIIQNDVSGILVPPEDIEKLSDAIQNVSENQDLRTKLGSNIREKITRDFKIEDMIQKTLENYKNTH